MMTMHILFEQHYIASGTLHSSNLLRVALMEMKLGKNAYDIVSMTTTYYLKNSKLAQAFTPLLLKLANSRPRWRLETWNAYILHHFHDDNRHFSLLLIFVGGLPPFTEIIRRNEWRQVNYKSYGFKKEKHIII